MILIISSSSHQNREALALGTLAGVPVSLDWKAEGGSDSALGHSGKDALQLWEGDRRVLGRAPAGYSVPLAASLVLISWLRKWF